MFGERALFGHDALDHFKIALLVNDKLADPAVPRPQVCEKLLEGLNVIFSQASRTVCASVTDVDHFALGDIVRVSGDFLEQFEVLADMAATSLGVWIIFGRAIRQTRASLLLASTAVIQGNLGMILNPG